MYESLRGATAILTRAPEDNLVMAARLRDAGALVIEVPCVRVEPLDDSSALSSALSSCAADDWVVVTSRAGADAVARAGRPTCRVAAIGDSTAARLAEHRIAVDFVPSIATGARLGRELPQARSALLARSDRAMTDLPEILRERGFAVREVVAYRTQPGASGDIQRARAALASGERVAIFCYAPSAVDGLAGAIDAEALERATFFVSGPATRHAVRERIGDVARITSIEEVTHVAHR